jgi:Rieske Fe-S protein
MSDLQQFPLAFDRSAGTTRRAVLRTAGLVAVVGGGAAALAACGADGATPATDPAPSAEASSTAPSPSASASESASASASPSASAEAPAGPSVTKAEVPEGGGIIMPDADYVVTQPEAGTYKAFSKICTHQSCPVSLITNREIVCNCHGSHFSISDGSVVSGPAQSPLPEAKTTVSGNNIVISA